MFDEIQLRTGLMNRTFTYHEGAVTKAHETAGKQVSEPTTTLVKEIRFHDGRTIAYEYDEEERITKVTDSADGVTEYTYDALGQLLTETKGSQTVSVTYDKYGNIQSKNGIPYSYGSDDANCCGWKDLLTAYNGKAITYDANGNPINYQGTAATWEKGRQLKTFGANSYKYNNDGIRIQKRTATEIHDYILDGTNIIKELVTDTGGCPKYTNEYLYDLDGTVCGIKHNGTAYYFYKNLQGDVIAITNATGAVVARYTYDAWGVCTIVSDVSGVDIANINPFRYRGYYYDADTNLYYLQSRYYDPVVGRFVNADNSIYMGKSGTVLGINLHAYCENNSICRADIMGTFWLPLIVARIAPAYWGNNLVHFVYNQAKSPSGFIYDQSSGKVANLRFGFFKSSFNGCGWIATYNALILLGKKPKVEEIILEYELTGAVLYGAFGVQPYAVTHYFRFRGYKVETTYNSQKVDSVAKKHTCNILFYWHNSGAHYFATKWNGSQFVGYNVWGSNGPEYLGKLLSKSFHNNQKRKIGVLISISKK